MQLSRKLLFFIGVASISTGWSSGLVRDGISARSQAMGGADVASARSPLEAMTANPAALTETKSASAEIAIDGVFLRAKLSRGNEKTVHLRNHSNFIGDIAVALPTGYSSVRWGLSASPSMAAAADWNFRDLEGGLTGKTTYGNIAHRSEFLACDFRVGLGVDLTSWLSAGASAGVVYNHNSLNTAYIFQSQKTLTGFKTRLDLDTDGYAASGQFAITLKPASSFKISAAYTLPSEIHSKGTARADLSAQLKSLGGGYAAVDPHLDADAEVLTKLPQKFTTGIAWQVTPQLLFSSEFDWIGWSSAFDELPVTLSSSTNTAVNDLVGSDRFTDVVPLHWRDQKVIRVGVEWELDSHWSVRGGFAHSSKVVPSETLTPLSAAIDDTVVSLGTGYRRDQWHLDFSWQWHLPKTRTVSNSILKTGEYDHSTLELESHWLGLTYGLEF